MTDLTVRHPQTGAVIEIGPDTHPNLRKWCADRAAHLAQKSASHAKGLAKSDARRVRQKLAEQDAAMRRSNAAPELARVAVSTFTSADHAAFKGA